ncbi:hypothetical protein MARILYN_58 [Vibrio phage Marilyn]|nr:hypothetical protein MARILYN_58 [Vibrio phage Marilyn]
MVNMNNENKNVSIRHIAHPLMSASVERFVAKPGTTIAEMLSEINYPIQNVDGVMVWLNGVPVENFDKVCIRSGDVVNIRPIVKGDNVGSILATIATIVISIYFPPAAAAAGFGKMASAFITAGAIFAATKLIYAAFPPPKPQEYSKKESYLLAGTQNRQRQYEPMPVVIGQMRVAPDSANMPYGTFEDNDQYVYQVFNFGLQKNLVISDYEIAGTKVGDFSEPPTITRSDEHGNLPAEFNDVEVIQGGEVKNDAGPLVKTTSKGAIRIDIDLQVVAYDVKDDGGISTKGISVEIRIFNNADNSLVSETSSVYSGDGVNDNRHTITGQDLPAGTYRVEITKASGDFSDSKKQRNLSVVAIKAFQEDKTDYSNYTRIGVKMKASNQLSGSIEELTALVHSEIPLFDGVSWNIGKTSNPAWWLLYWARGLRTASGQILFGAGLGDHQINMEQIKRFAAFCDRKKLTCNMWLNREATVKQVADVIARCGRGEYTWGTGKFGAIFDDDQLSEIAVFGPSNVRAGSFKVNYNADQTADEVIVNYLNEDDHYNADSVRVNVGNTQTPERPIQFQFEGCTNTDMAGREARMIAAAQELMRRTVSWETDIEGVFLKRGDVVRLSHDMIGWSESGRVRAAVDRKTFFIDKAINFTSAAYIGIRTPDGKYETFKIAKVEGLKVTLKDTPPVNFKMPGEINTTSLDWLWFYDEGGKPGKLVKITDIQPKDVHTLSFTAKDYLEEYYQSETGDYVHVEKPETTLPVNNIIPGVLAWESYRASGENKILVLALSWIPISTVNNYTVRIWDSQVGGEKQSTTSNSGIRFDVSPGTYNYRISGTDSITGAIYSAVGTITITGSATVNPLTEVRAEGMLGGIIVSWKYPTNALNLRKVDIVARWNALDGSQSYVETFSEPYPINTLTHSGLDVAQRVDYELTLVDAEGNKSTPVNVFGITSDNIDQIIDAIDGQLGESALDQSLKDRIDKIDSVDSEFNQYKQQTDAELAQVNAEIAAAKQEASQGINEAKNEITDVNNTLTGAVNNANSEIDQVKQDLANAVSQEQENNAQLKKELEALIAVAGVTTYSQPDQPAKGKEGDIWFKEDAQGNVIDVYRFHNGAWELSSHADIEANAAAIINEQTVRASADEALGHRIDALVVKTGSNEAAITAESTARANADSAITQLVNEVKATSEGNSAAIKSEETARTDADTALANKIDALTTTVGKNTADITTEQTVRANADTALSQRIDRVSSKSDQNEAAISAESTTRASADGALSMRIDSVTAKAGANESAIQSEITARTDADSALSSRIDSVTAKAAQNEAAITAEATARADADKAFASSMQTISAEVTSNKENAGDLYTVRSIHQSTKKVYIKATQKYMKLVY